MTTITHPAFDVAAIAALLTEDHDKYVADRDDGQWTFRLRIEHDDLTVADIEDPEVFGRYQYGEYGRERDRNRPDGFTGAAVKIASESSQGDFYWYEPPKDFRRFKGSGFTSVEEWEAAKARNLVYVRNLLSWGYIYIAVSLTHERPDGYKRSWSSPGIGGVESSTGLWGEDLKNHQAYVATIIADEIGELIHEIKEEA